jgi:protein-disulfide isomerase
MRSYKISFIILILAAMVVVGFDTVSAQEEVIATLNGQPITLSDAEEKIAFRIYRLRGNIYHILKREVQKIVDEKLLAAEAARRQLTVDELLQKEVDDKLLPLEETEVDRYLAEHPSDAGISDQKRNRVRTYLSQKARIRRKLEFISMLRENANVEYLLQPPQRPRTTISIQGQPWRGSADAPVTLIHFASFNRELCVQSVRMIHRLMDEYPGRIKWVHRNYFTVNDEKALAAAQAGEMAFTQGKFWEFHDTLYAREGRFELEDINRISADLGLSITDEKPDNEQSRLLLSVKKDLNTAARIGVTTVPVIFINGLYFSPTFPYTRLKSLVSAELGSNAALSKAHLKMTDTKVAQNPKGGDARK